MLRGLGYGLQHTSGVEVYVLQRSVSEEHCLRLNDELRNDDVHVGQGFMHPCSGTAVSFGALHAVVVGSKSLIVQGL